MKRHIRDLHHCNIHYEPMEAPEGVRLFKTKVGMSDVKHITTLPSNSLLRRVGIRVWYKFGYTEQLKFSSLVHVNIKKFDILIT